MEDSVLEDSMHTRNLHLRLLPLTRSAMAVLSGFFRHSLATGTDADRQRFRSILELGLQLGESHPRLHRPGVGAPDAPHLFACELSSGF